MNATQRALFLRKIHLFRDLNDNQLLQIAEKFSEESFDAGYVILEQGTSSDNFYLIYSGRVRVYRRRDGMEEDLANLVSGDYFGEMEILGKRGPRTATVAALEATTVLRLSGEKFAEILKMFPIIKPNIEISIASRKLARTVEFKWLRPGEVVYFLARKHSFFLIQALIAPVLALSIPAFFFLWGVVSGSVAAISFGVLTLLIVLGWVAWNVVDWGNDYYIVTNQRVVWVEKVIGLYDSRNEAPLTEILSVGVESDLVGRALDYGDVLVRTFVGAIPFRRVFRPYQAAHMVEEYWERTQQASEHAEKEAFKDALRKRLGILPPIQEEATPMEEVVVTPPERPNFIKVFLINLFRQRIEEGEMITYRKHWFVLLRQVFIPTLIFIGLLGLFLRHLYILAISPELALIQTLEDGSRALDTAAVTLPLLIILILGWWIYRYVDWINDIFRVTTDQILDIDRKPLGTEERRAAPLDSILGTRYERIGFLGYMLNFGTVYIDVGSAQFAFEDVLDPAVVQSDIDRRRLKRESGKKAAEKEEERNRMANWVATYHRNVDEFRREQELKDRQSKTE
ncbi:MAG: cyclic nucleotide-binding domain-containing protein [Anaerolineales bacterium]